MPPSDGIAQSVAGAQRGDDAPLRMSGGWSRISSVLWLAIALVLTALLLTAVVGPVPAGQATLNGLVGAGYFALGAVGLTLVYGVLRLVNFAHGDMLTFGTYAALLLNAGFAWPFALAILGAIVAT